jgi:hypothetical protein
LAYTWIHQSQNAEVSIPRKIVFKVSWRPSATHGATVRGVCSADFKRSIEETYLSAHGAEFGIPAAGGGKRVERLEN